MLQIAIVAALALLGVVAVTIVTISLQQEAEARGAKPVKRSMPQRDDASIHRRRRTRR
jgi:hypothetical protein